MTIGREYDNLLLTIKKEAMNNNDDNWVYAGSRICMRKDIGLNGNLFGGNILSWADEFAAIFARKVTRQHFVVTLRFGEIVFKKPVNEGDLVDFYCRIEKKGHTSVTFSIKAILSEKYLKDAIFTTDCTFVAVDENSRPLIIIW